MRFATIAAVFSVVAGASAAAVKNGTEYTTTEVVTKYTTYCPLPTTSVEGNKTYTVTKVCIPFENWGCAIADNWV